MYYESIKAYYAYQVGKTFDIPEFRKYISDKDYLNGTRVAFISNLMLAVKEKIVDNKGNMEYESKIFMDALENSVSFIATKVETGYKLSNYVFPNAATLVAILRNKLAHGKYWIDFDHNRVVFNHKGIDIVVNIDKLTIFILKAYSSTLKRGLSTKYQRNLMYNASGNFGREKTIQTEEEIRKIIKNFYYVDFIIESTNGMPVMEDCSQYLEGFINLFKRDYTNALKSDFYKKMVKYFKDRDCVLKIEYKSLRDREKIKEIIDYAKIDLIDNPTMTYIDQVRIIGQEVEKRINGNYKNMSAVQANINNLIFVEGINQVGADDDKKLCSFSSKFSPNGLKLSYDELGMTLIAMFNAIYIYPFDDVYDTSGEYSYVREDVFDFATLDLSVVNPSVLTINDSPLVNAKAKLDGIVKKQVMFVKKILQQEKNLGKVSGNANAVNAINKGLNDLKTNLGQLVTDYLLANKEYETIRKDYTDNALYFRNKAIIEGIRNSIAHGHYEFISRSSLWDTEIIFNDIYEGNLTCQIKMTFGEFAQLIENNQMNIIDYINNKKSSLKKKLN